MTQNLPRSMQGRAPSLAMQSLADFRLRAGASAASVQGGFESIYEQGVNDVLRGTGKETFEAVNFLKKVNPAQYRPENGAQYPRGPFGNALRADRAADQGGRRARSRVHGRGRLGHARAEGGARGQLANLLSQFSQGIYALVTDLGPTRMEDVVVLTMSEFGRTARQNGTGGTDHGHANAMFVVGGAVRGGKVYGEWPGLAEEQLHEGRDLALTTDFRDVFGEVASKHLGAADLKKVFPGHASGPAKFRGLLG